MLCSLILTRKNSYLQTRQLSKFRKNNKVNIGISSYLKLLKNKNLHLSINHSDIPNKYACGEENCSRKFENIKSLKCHLHKKHNNNHKVYSLVVSPHENEVVPNQFEPATNNEVDEGPIESVPKKTAVEDQNDDLFKSLLKFALYLHCLPNMPRSIAVK
jgi:hypothetical protein